jgi:SAM-dependent methyltransferase
MQTENAMIKAAEIHPPWLVEVIACPSCHQPLALQKDSRLECMTCLKEFPVTPKGQPDLRLTVPNLLSPPVKKSNSPALIQRLRRGLTRRYQRRIYGLGNQVECCYCNWTGLKFLPAGDRQAGNRLCPGCGSLERYRALYLYLKEHSNISFAPTTVLDVATKPCFRTFCQSLPNVRYVSSDLMIFSDLTQMGMASESFDIITCMHVMEHIPNDLGAFGEIARLLKPNGFAIVVVPLKSEKTLEDPDARTEDYERLYGQYDHVRYYGMDIVERMETVGLNVEVIDVFKTHSDQVLRRHGLYGDDRYFFRLSPSHEPQHEST